MGGKILVVGGAGYIGSHCVRELDRQGFIPVILDNLCRGHEDAVMVGEFIKADLVKRDQVRAVFKKHKIEGVMHFAALAYVGESVEKPDIYYGNNVTGIINLLDIMNEFNVRNIIFSSTCAVYGIPLKIPIPENHVMDPVSPYGRSKRMCEEIIRDYASAYNTKYIFFRYFNAAGASGDARIGERHDPETHLIPLALRTAMGKVPELRIFGTDYDTPDGTCIRDYVHVEDICNAHVLGYKYLQENGPSDIFNLGNGNGYSVKEIVETCREVSENEIKTVESPRRPGDPPRLVGSSEKAARILGWQIKYVGIKDIIKSAWEFYKKELI
jgi:UDP-glucose 4-epimerase